MKRVGLDVGGTHTDLVLVDDASGEIAVAKVPTDVGDPSIGAIAALEALCRSAACTPADIDHFMHGTTIATNIVLEHNGARVGLITTEGFRDELALRRGFKESIWDVRLEPPPEACMTMSWLR